MASQPTLQSLITKGGCGQVPAVGVATRKAFVSYYACVLKQLPGTYQGNDKTYKGYSWSRLYTTLAAKFPNSDPKAVAQQVLGIYGAQVVATGIGETVKTTGNTVTIAGKAALATFAPGGSSPACALFFPGVAGIGQFCILSKTAIRAMAGAGVLLAATGVGAIAVIVLTAFALHETGAGKAAVKAAKYVPLLAV